MYYNHIVGGWACRAWVLRYAFTALVLILLILLYIFLNCHVGVDNVQLRKMFFVFCFFASSSSSVYSGI